ncbi:hypothetical protein O0L34_g2849 [Tuta absoluta]|nr:hypothetical protein O0L34_g2849 [Tuta absoluta]
MPRRSYESSSGSEDSGDEGTPKKMRIEAFVEPLPPGSQREAVRVASPQQVQEEYLDLDVIEEASDDLFARAERAPDSNISRAERRITANNVSSAMEHVRSERADSEQGQVGTDLDGIKSIIRGELSHFLRFRSDPVEGSSQKTNLNHINDLSDFVPPILPNSLVLDQLATTISESTKKSDPSRVESVKKLQHFGDPDWAGIRYADTQKKFLASPAFTYLDLNEELLAYEHKPLFLRSLDQTFGVLTNMLLAQREAVQAGVKELLALPGVPDTLHKKLSDIFASGSLFADVSKDMLQVVCGRRASIIEQRRDSVLKAVRDKYHRAMLSRIPPSCGNLFEKTAFSDAVAKLGGGSKIFYKPLDKRQSSPSRTSVGLPNFRTPTNSGATRPRSVVAAVLPARAAQLPARRADASRPRPQQRRSRQDGRSNKRH